MKQREKVGIDAGGTLIKVAFMRNNELVLEKFASREITALAEWINTSFPGADLCLTGGKSKLLEADLAVEHVLTRMLEFEATCAGAFYLRKQQMPQANGPFILTNVGTGTSVHAVNLDNNRRIIGTGVGGGTLLGLSSLLTGEGDYEAIVGMAKQGIRERIDLKVSHIYEGAEPPIPGELTASNFGRVLPGGGEHRTEDVLASIMGMVGETVTTVSVMAAAQCGMKEIVYAGSAFDANPVLRDVVNWYTRIRECEPQLLENGGYCGAIGALLSLG
jgi:type II pantothenate kinase